MLIRKKILFVSARLPYPAVEGHQIRTFGILNQLSKQYDVHLLSLLRVNEEVDQGNALGSICTSIVGVKVSSGIRAALLAGMSSLIQGKPLVVTKYVTTSLKKEFLRKIENVKPDIIHFDLLPLAGLIELIPKGIKVVLNEHNVESDLISQKLKTLESFFDRLIYQREYKLLLKFEKDSCIGADAVLACSEQDATDLKVMGVNQVYCIPNGVDAKRLQPDNTNKENKTLVFLGGMGWYPNRLGIVWFINEVFPLILKRDPKVKLQLIGNPEPLVEIPYHMQGNVEKLGFVDDFVPYIQKASVMIVPLTVGSGTRLKVVEGLALGKCMVSTRKGAEGIGLTNGESVIFADTPEEFSDEVINVLKGDLDVFEIEISARTLAEDIYDWDVIGAYLNTIYDQLMVESL
jgi:glycosyltransferase involved in cell wall biosynthesis